MARYAGKRGRNVRFLGGRMALASAALAGAAMLGGTALADELTTDSVESAADVVVLDVPTTWTGPDVLVRRGRGKDDGANHARKGADNPPGDDRRGHGKDDGANHA